MDVLNTYGGGLDRFAVFLAIVAVLFAIVLFAIAFKETELSAFLAGLVCAAFAVVLGLNATEPVRHEVTLRPGYVIDATKYEIIEQRGQIYVIEERKIAE